jgi:hypothetical protein
MVYNRYIRKERITMAHVTKGVAQKAREDKARRARLELDRLTVAVNEATSDEGRKQTTAALSAYYEEQAQEEERKNQLKNVKVAVRAARNEAAISTGTSRRIQWTEGGRELVPGLSSRAKQFHAAAEGNLVKCSREISRWETAVPYDNVRGIRKGEILMVIGENYMGDNDKSVVDVMVGPDIVKGIPAAALRPLDG